MSNNIMDIRLLGGVRLMLGGRPLTGFVSRKAAALLIYLACNGRPTPREVAAALLWGDSDQRRALANLSVALSSLRKSVADYLQSDRYMLAFNRQHACFVDVVQFEEAVSAVEYRALDQQSAAHLEQAVKLYEGDFLAGFHLRNTPDFESWAMLEQERYRRLMLKALHKLVDYYREEEQFIAGIEHARRLLALDPLDEAMHRRLMHLLVRAGNRGQALTQYELCTQILADELGLQPEPETTALAEAVRIEAFLPEDRPLEEKIAVHSPAAAQARHNLPMPVTPFFGREEELAWINIQLQQPTGRLLVIVGPGGVGKTRLAQEAARIQASHFRDGARLISLTNVEDVEAIAPTVAQAAGLNLTGSADPQEQLLDYLSQREMLLILDNVEHLLSPEPRSEQMVKLFQAIRAHADQVCLLVTSRERLSLPEQTLLILDGLPYPEQGRAGQPEPLVNLEHYPAVRMLIERARHQRPHFTLTLENQEAVLSLCRLVAGMPLALELAATWIRVLDVAAIVQEVEADLDLLATERLPLPDRHRSLRAVFDASWKQLPPNAQRSFRRLSCFRGGFTRQAGKVIGGVSLPILATLIDSSFLRRDDTGRFHSHPLLQQFAAEKLASDGVEEVETVAAHAYYFAALLAEEETKLAGPEVRQALTRLLPELENVRAAWQWSIAQSAWQPVTQMMEGLALLFRLRSLFREGQALFQQALDALPPAEDDQALNAALLVRRGIFEYYLSQFEEARQTFVDARTRVETVIRSSAALEASRRLARKQLPNIYFNLGVISDTTSNSEQAVDLFETALVHARANGDLHIESRALNSLGVVAWGAGHYTEAEEYMQSSLALAEKLGDKTAVAHRLVNLGWVSNLRGLSGRGLAYSSRSRDIFQELGDRGGLADSFYTMGIALDDLGRYQEALILEEEALTLQREIGSRYGVVGCLAALGEIYLHMAAFDKAGIHLRQALREALAIDVDTITVPLLVGFAELYHYQRRPEEALALLSLALEHPAMLEPYRVRGRRLVQMLTQEIGPERQAAALEKGAGYKLEEIVYQLLVTGRTR